MTAPQVAGVIDIGKTNAKFALVDLKTRSEIAVRKAPNTVVMDGPYPHFDIDRLWDFLSGAIVELNHEHKIDALSVTTHGASAALLDADGDLALPVLDYEYAGPDVFAADYDAARPSFAECFSPRLPMGLNLGAQLFWQSRAFPGAFADTQSIVTYPQYWSYRLSGVLASEITSLGCHTDLWNFQTDLYSSLVVRQGWLEKMPSVRLASDVLGPVRPELMARLGLTRPVPVICGIHDSNASLLPHLLARHPPFAVVSTGTWVIVCAPGAELSELDPARDCLANIDAFGRPVASARFMGGREFSQLLGDEPVAASEATIEAVLREAILLLPSVVEGSGPFPHRRAHWSVPREKLDRETVFAVTSFYLAMMTAECLKLSGAAGETVVEGPFASNRLFTEMLAAATERPVVAMAASATGTSIGAALLTDIVHAKLAATAVSAQPPSTRLAAMTHYAHQWRTAVSAR
jgi:sugar (pentulose or hexulose) kinase